MLTYINVSAEFVGVDPNFAEYLVSIGNAGSALGRILSGYLGDRYGEIDECRCSRSSHIAVILHLGPLNVMAPSAFLAGITTFIWPFLRMKSSFIVLGLING